MMTTNSNNNKRAADQLDDSKRRKMLPVPALQSSSSCSSSSDDDDNSDVEIFSSPARNVHCVLFVAEPIVSLIPNRLEYSEEEAEEIWYSRMEKQAMIQGALKSASDLDPDDSRARGLEPLTFAGSQRRRENRYYTTNAVLSEQARLKRRHGKTVPANSDEVLSQSVAHISRRCQELANMQGQRDEIAVFPEMELKVSSYGDSMDCGGGGKGGDMLDGFRETLRGFSFGWLMADSQ